MKTAASIGLRGLILLAAALAPRAEAGTRTMGSDVLIGNAIDGLSPTGTNPYLYDFAGDSLDMAGYKIYYNADVRNVVLTNLPAIVNGGSVDTSRSGNNNHTGYIELYAGGPVTFASNLTTRSGSDATTGWVRVYATDIRIGGSVRTDNAGWNYSAGAVTLNAPGGEIAITNFVTTYNYTSGGLITRAGAVAMNAVSIVIAGESGGYAVGAYGYHPGNKGGASVTLTATNGVTLSTGGIGAHGYVAGDALVSDGAGGSAGDVYIGGSITTYAKDVKAGAITVLGKAIRVTGNLNADYLGADVDPGFQPILISGSGIVRIDGYVTASGPDTQGIRTGNHNVDLIGASVTVNGTTNGYSVLAYTACNNDAAGNITLIATNGDITVAGGYDAYSAKTPRPTFDGYITNIASGNITIGSLNAARFRAITLIAGSGKYNNVFVTGVLTNFTKSESPKRFTFPAGSVVSNDVYYLAASNTAMGLTGTYRIYVGATDTGKDLKEGPPPRSAPGTIITLR